MVDEARVLDACGAGAAVAIVGGAFGVMVGWKSGCSFKDLHAERASEKALFAELYNVSARQKFIGL